MGVSLTVVNDIVTAATVTPMATDQTSIMYQNAFVGGFKTFVVGKNLADISVRKVSGASLTSKGFTEALATIRTQAGG